MVSQFWNARTIHLLMLIQVAAPRAVSPSHRIACYTSISAHRVLCFQVTTLRAVPLNLKLSHCVLYPQVTTPRAVPHKSPHCVLYLSQLPPHPPPRLRGMFCNDLQTLGWVSKS